MDKMQDFHKRIRELRNDLKSYAKEDTDPRSAALSETAGEVLGGLEKAYDDYMHKSEKAWQ